MNRFKLCFFFLFFTLAFYAQNKTVYTEINSDKKTKINPVFYQFDLSVPLVANVDRGETYPDGNRANDSWFLPNGVAAKFGCGIQKKDWVGLSLHTGIDWKANDKLVCVPVFGNLRLSPGFINETRLVLQAGYGYGFAIGRGNLNGNYQKYSIGIENGEDLNMFFEVSGYGFDLHHRSFIGFASLGVSLRTF